MNQIPLYAELSIIVVVVEHVERWEKSAGDHYTVMNAQFAVPLSGPDTRDRLQEVFPPRTLCTGVVDEQGIQQYLSSCAN